MLIVVSDLHLSDGTCSKTVAFKAFEIFCDRVRELAYDASWDKDGSYKPVETISLVLMGDILDPLHSTLWLDELPGAAGYIRPWSDPRSQKYAEKISAVTHNIIRENRQGLELLGRLSRGEVVSLPPASKGRPDHHSKARVSPRFQTYYMVGNHDWYYHLPGPQFDAIRAELIDLMGLSNPVGIFPWKMDEYGPLHEMLVRYRVHAHHGDIYDNFNYNRETGRDTATLGDVFSMEVLNRFPLQVQKELGTSVPPVILDSLRKLTNIRPALATPLWINGQIKRYAGSRALQNKLKKIWDQLGDEFLQIDFVREQDKAFQFDLVDAMELVVKISKKTSFNTINDLVIWVREKMWGGELSYANHALREPAFLKKQALYIVYGHIHHHEIISLDTIGNPPVTESQIYFNSGTWHSYYDLAIRKPEEQKFVPYQTMTYLVFYQEHERGERKFEAWSGSFA